MVNASSAVGPIAAREPLQELTIGLLADRAGVEERLDVLEKGPLTRLHPIQPPDSFRPPS